MNRLDLTDSELSLLRDILCDTQLLATYTPGLVARNPNTAKDLDAIIRKVRVPQAQEG